MPKILSNNPLAGAVPLPPALKITEYRYDLIAPRISFAVKSLTTNPTAVLFDHYDVLAAALHTTRYSRGVRDAFDFLFKEGYIVTKQVPLVHSSTVTVVQLTTKGELLALELGYEKVSNDWDLITSNRSIDEPYYIGQVTQVAFQCRIRGVEAEVSPWIASDNPPDLLVGKEGRWVYTTGSQILTRKALARLAESASIANKPLGFITQRKRHWTSMAETCKKLGIAAWFSDVERLVKATRDYRNGSNKENGKLWLHEV
ncbi:MAG: hypothetical protein K8R77_01870 [Anaerolineaceae bacterium]|nr:hypothetical protein [Anaerolineaceae bacterium]